MARYAILAIDLFNHIENRTSNMLIRYKPNEVVAIIDPAKKGLKSEDVIQIGGDIPVVDSFLSSQIFKPDHLVIGNAPRGGIVSKKMFLEIKVAILNGVNIVNGMHQFLSDDEYLKNLAKTHNSKIFDFRKPPNPPNFSKGFY